MRGLERVALVGAVSELGATSAGLCGPVVVAMLCDLAAPGLTAAGS